MTTKQVISSALMVLFSFGANASLLDTMNEICHTSTGGEMLNLTQNAQLAFLNDANGDSHKQFLVDGRSIEFDSLGMAWQQQILDGLKYNYDVVACVSKEGKVFPSLGVLTTEE